MTGQCPQLIPQSTLRRKSVNADIQKTADAQTQHKQKKQHKLTRQVRHVNDGRH
jgi:hypothetical protein